MSQQLYVLSVHFVLDPFLFSPFPVFLLSSVWYRVRTRSSPCSWSRATSTSWSTLFGRITSPKRAWRCWRLLCPGKDEVKWANQTAASRYKMQGLMSHLRWRWTHSWWWLILKWDVCEVFHSICRSSGNLQLWIYFLDFLLIYSHIGNAKFYSRAQLAFKMFTETVVLLHQYEYL